MYIYSDYSSDSEKTKNRNMPSKRKKERSKLATNGILKFDSISCEELDPKVLLYNRIFKTGSSTTESIITKMSSVMNYDYKIGEIIRRDLKRAQNQIVMIRTA